MVVLVYLVLAALYESWTSPPAVISVVPIALVGVLLALVGRGEDNNLYPQIGLGLMIALASKNAILIFEFARDLRRKGHSITEAAVEATGRRFSFVLGGDGNAFHIWRALQFRHSPSTVSKRAASSSAPLTPTIAAPSRCP